MLIILRFSFKSTVLKDGFWLQFELLLEMHHSKGKYEEVSVDRGTSLKLIKMEIKISFASKTFVYHLFAKILQDSLTFRKPNKTVTRCLDPKKQKMPNIGLFK